MDSIIVFLIGLSGYVFITVTMPVLLIAANEIEKFNQWLWDSGLDKKLTEKQRTVFQVAKNGIVTDFTIRNVESNLGCSYNTAANVLNGLVTLNLFKKVKRGKEWFFYMIDKSNIVENWES